MASADPAGEVARQFALNLRKAVGDRSLRAAGEATGVDHTTIQAILTGSTWPDLETIAKLEIGLDANLWPRRRKT
jgi:transcriptional regulator with XRE-family HTH domain